MREYLIKVDDGEFLVPHRDALAETLHLPGYNGRHVPGEGECRIRCGDVELAFYLEEPGIHVVAHAVDGPSDTLVDAVAAQVAAATGQATSVVSL